MTDLDFFYKMLMNGHQDFHRDAFCGVIRITVVVAKFSSWSNTISGISKGIPYNVIYIFKSDGSFVSSTVNMDSRLVY